MRSDLAEIEARLLYRDGLCLVVNKPAGLAVHSGSGSGPSMADWLVHLRLGRSTSPQVAHRLDRDTTGCLVLGRHPKALRRLGELFAMPGAVRKVYWALLADPLPEDEGVIDLPLSEKNRQGLVEVDPAGKPAQTEYRVLGWPEGRVWVELRPRTGRTHQLRVHLAALGCPIVGDTRYGGATGHGLLLHARSISLPIYPRREPVSVEAPLPAAWPRGIPAG